MTCLWYCISLCFQVAFFWVNVKFSYFSVYTGYLVSVGTFFFFISLPVLYHVNLPMLDLCFPEFLSLDGSSLELAKSKFIWDLGGRSEGSDILQGCPCFPLVLLFSTTLRSSSWWPVVILSSTPGPEGLALSEASPATSLSVLSSAGRSSWLQGCKLGTCLWFCSFFLWNFVS